jgi:TatD DNase family protein
VITFKSATDLHQIVKEVPLNKIVLETDAPFMCPVPHRGGICHSGHIPHIAEKIAELKRVDVDKVYAATRQNTKQLYGV